MKESILAAIAVLFIGAGAQAKEPVSLLLTTKNVCTLEGAVDGNSMAKLKVCIVDKVIKRKRKRYPIYIYIKSGGGQIYHGIRFIQFAKTISNLHTITEFSASMAAAIVQGIPGQRYIVDNGVMMFHRARGGVQGQFEDGEVERRLALWKKIVRSMEVMQAQRIGIPLAEYKEKRKDEWWLYGSGAVEQGTADRSAQVKCSVLLMSKSKTVTKKTPWGSYEVTTSDCPLMN